MFIIVDLPQPEWPRMQTNSPFDPEAGVFEHGEFTTIPSRIFFCISRSMLRSRRCHGPALFNVEATSLERMSRIQQHADSADRESER
jgi:hypothetical protein